MAAFRGFIKKYCLECHDGSTRSAGLALDELLDADLGSNAEAWEKVVRKLSARQMPPHEAARPEESPYQSALSALTGSLDAAAAKDPNPGRTETFRRLTRTEYKNAIRDLLALEIDVNSLLPPDESSYGFDNVTVSDLSPALLNRYLSAAQKISRMALGRVSQAPSEETFRVRPDITQDTHLDGLPLDTRGGTLITFHFPQDGSYEIQVRLMRDRNEGVEGLSEPHELEVAVDRQRIELFTVAPSPEGLNDPAIDGNLNVRFHATAGPHQIGVAFLTKGSSLLETTRQPLNVHYNFYRHPRLGPAVYQVSLIGPFEPGGPGHTPSRQRILVCTPKDQDDEDACAKRIVASLMRQAFRRAVHDDDLKTALDFYRQGRAEGDFESGIELALSSILVQPQFLLRIERDPPGIPPGATYQISGAELASRLSFFLWSSIPDEELLGLAESGALSRSEVLEQQARRMLADERSRSLVTNFAAQWLHLRNLDAVIPDMRLFPDFDDNLRQAMRRETELFFEDVVRQDRSLLELIQAKHTYLNERLARHYGIPHIHGSRFRRVSLESDCQRGGLLRQASILSVTSYATRTSPVIRGQWILKNLLGSPPPPPPENVPALVENAVSQELPVRERLQQHRANAACASCHELMDPVGFALENFDAIGCWRDREAGRPIDASGGLPDGSQFVGVSGLEQTLLDRPELFARTLTEKLMTFALGRGIDYYDAPAIRRIVADARVENYRFSEVVLGIVNSTPFQMRRSP